MNRSAKLITMLFALAALTSDCLVVGTDGPMRAGGDSSTLCTPALAKGFAAIGDVVHNDGDGNLSITEVELVRATGLTHEDSYIMLIERMEDEVLGSASTVSDDPRDIANWERRIKLDNFTLAPGDVANVIVTLSLPATGTDGQADAMRITYTDGARDFTAETTMKIVLAGEEGLRLNTGAGSPENESLTSVDAGFFDSRFQPG
ncbi:hypothetical protein [Arthrobacter roseus]|uniref:hypothetical protein n=1 Tax=Arthrobacter roseus TaxID=136274 RepID=UPI00196540B7|nr:hypothetical protein [Arthrobacter roseus]MBM7847559.1 hypothetical protein [Arthrobacter roseus]